MKRFGSVSLYAFMHLCLDIEYVRCEPYVASMRVCISVFCDSVL